MKIEDHLDRFLVGFFCAAAIAIVSVVVVWMFVHAFDATVIIGCMAIIYGLGYVAERALK